MFPRDQYAKAIKTFAFAHDKMAFVTGPRRVGKTILAEQMLEERGRGKLFNWDDVVFRRQWIKDPKALIPEIVGEKTLVVLDEIHKAARWKSYLKGLYDTKWRFADILVTGSARLDHFRKGGESLLGRYYLFRMHPLTLGELLGANNSPDALQDRLQKPLIAHKLLLSKLLEFGGFPEPFLKADPAQLNLWRRHRVEILVREDLRDIARAQELAMLEAMFALLPEKVGSPLSFNTLREDLEVSYPTVKRWIGWASQLFYLWILPPYSKNVVRAIRKEPKIYLWDWTEIQDPGTRFENLIASHLLKACHFWTDTGVGHFELFYVRDKEKREADFLIVRDKKPWMLVECKVADRSLSQSLLHFSKRLKPLLTVQICQESGLHEFFDIDGHQKGILISADAFLALLP